MLQRALGLPPDEVTVRSNDPRFLTGIVPSGNVITTANELSRFFELLRAGGELDGVRILEPRTIRRATSERAFREIDFSLVAPLRHASGFMLGARAVSLFGPDTEQAFGHLGFTNVLGWADPERALSVGLVTSGKPMLHPALGDLWLLTREDHHRPRLVELRDVDGSHQVRSLGRLAAYSASPVSSGSGPVRARIRASRSASSRRRSRSSARVTTAARQRNSGVDVCRRCATLSTDG